MSTARAASEPMIRLDQLTKHYPGQEAPAVDGIDLAVPQGEIVILVGPSGCGKTTTLEMINRLIEPSSGRIFLEGEDVTHVNPDHLRRRMGYVIQQIGLFPHQTIAQNIATVPRMLGWDDKRVNDRVEELLHLVGLDPARYRDRYPKEMSGGQRQRVGVARAMAADPPVMLMDEPFGATDPITRERLQNEFLRIQEDIRKTIVFVTHDIDEAIKMGDRIVILAEGSRIAQYDTPEAILTNPASEFVEQFLGSGILLKRLNLSRVEDVHVATSEWMTIGPDSTAEHARQLLQQSGRTHLLLLDDQRRPARWIAEIDLDRQGGFPAELSEAGTRVQACVDSRATLNDALQEMLLNANGVAAVVDRDGAYAGTLDLETIIAAIREMRAKALDEASSTAARGHVTAVAVGGLDSRVVGRERSLLRRLRYVGVPAVVAIACAAMYLYVQSQELDNIESRIINARVIRTAAFEQIEIALWATALTLVVAVPLGIALTRPWARRVTPIIIALANIGQGVPAIGLLFFIYIVLIRNGSTAAILGMAIYAVLPVLRGTMVGLQQVDRGVVKAARGMGMSKRSVLFRVEMPLAVPILLTGVRTALVLTVATAVLAAFIGGGTFGELIIGGQAQGRPLAVAVGSLGAATLAILADWIGGIAEDLLRPKGL